MTSAQHDIDHLEFPDGGHATVQAHAHPPPHIWTEVLPGLERCIRCHVRRFQLCGDTVFQHRNQNRLLAGAEPRCKRRRG